MISTFLVSVLLMPIYLGWFMCILAPFLLLPLALLGGIWIFLHPSLWVPAALAQSSVTVRNATAIDDGSPIVDFATVFPGLSMQLGLKKSRPVRGRHRIGEMLMAAQGALPEGYRLMVDECYRSLSEDRATPDSGHSSGGAVDVGLTDARGRHYDLGERTSRVFDWLGQLNSVSVSREAADNRRIMSGVLKKVGFVNNASEWWHWSYGDRYWSASTGAESAIYAEPLSELQMV